MTVSIRQDRHLIRASAHSERFIVAEIEAPPAPRRAARPPVNLAFVLDRSGSMGGEKIHLAKAALREALGRLHDDDRFSIVVYDDRIDVVVPCTIASAEARRNGLARLDEIDARGSTNLGEGWLRGCEQVGVQLVREGVNRCLLLTDGLANVGIVDPEALRRHSEELRARGVTTSTFGVGADFDENLLQAMADAGGGHFYFIANAAAIVDTISSEVGETLEIVARDVALRVEAPAGVDVEPISPLPVSVHDRRVAIALGDLVSGQVARVVVRLRFPYGEVGRRTGAVLAVMDRDGVLADGGTQLTFEYADHAANDAQARDREVDRAVAVLFASKARQAATRLNRHGDFDAARRELQATARRIRDYAGRDRELRDLVTALERDAEAFSMPMHEIDRKHAFFAGSTLARMRSPEGHAMRRAPAERS